jgi:hypothetical protein
MSPRDPDVPPNDGRYLPEHCSHCGSDRLIPLSFESADPDDDEQADDGGPDIPERKARPVKKCVACGAHLFAGDLA